MTTPLRVTTAPVPPRSITKLRLGLCCRFVRQPISFRTTTATSLLRIEPADQQLKLSGLCRANAESLLMALQYCAHNEIGCFRIGSSILPVKTHPQVGYSVDDLPDAEVIISAFRCCGTFAAEHGIRTVFHPDQFVVLSSPREDVVEKSIKELENQAEVADWVGADVINIHGGGAYGDKAAALARFIRNVNRLPYAVRSRLTIENDDKVYTPKDLLPLCRATGVPLVYDVHHHRCLPDGLTIEQATDAALCTWRREPLFHISSPLEGWSGTKPQRHHEYVDLSDFPDCWRQHRITVEVEAKAKELAVLRLRDELLSPLAASSRRPCRAGVNT
jgi:UV DNA damage endonuclease